MARTDLPLTTPKSIRRREELLDAAQRTFVERGYFETRAADIAKAANVSHGTFYTHFDSKDHVLRELVEKLAEDLFEAAAEPTGNAGAAIDVLKSTIRTFMHAYRDRAGMIRVLEQATASNPEFLKIRLAIRNRFSTRLEAILLGQLNRHRSDATGRRPTLDPTTAAYALGGMVEDFARGCYVLGVLVDEETAIDTLTFIWARAVGLRLDAPRKQRV